MKHFLSLQESSAEEMSDLIAYGATLKAARSHRSFQPLAGQTWGMIFTKSSTRTRVSFEVGIRELGGQSLFLSSNDLQLGRGEPIKDTARVLGRMLGGCIIRTFDQQDVVDFANFGKIPTINALTDEEHPCQIIADLLTIQEQFGTWRDKTVCFYGDGDCNVARSWMWAAAKLGFPLRIVAPKEFQPPVEYLATLPGDFVSVTDDPVGGAVGADVIYTDVWVSMGKENESADRIKILEPYQVSAETINTAAKDAVVMHCLPGLSRKGNHRVVFGTVCGSDFPSGRKPATCPEGDFVAFSG
jgi:ornithine carbamoyltransferase